MAERSMPSFSKSPPEPWSLSLRSSTATPTPSASRCSMFLAAFVGNMATGLFADRWVVRLPAAEIDAAKTAGAEGFEPMPGKPMKAFVVIPAADVDDDTRIMAWVERGPWPTPPRCRPISRRRRAYSSLLATSAAMAGSAVSITITKSDPT